MFFFKCNLFWVLTLYFNIFFTFAYTKYIQYEIKCNFGFYAHWLE